MLQDVLGSRTTRVFRTVGDIVIVLRRPSANALRPDRERRFGVARVGPIAALRSRCEADGWSAETSGPFQIVRFPEPPTTPALIVGRRQHGRRGGWAQINELQ
jgi:hypothetical protein